MLKNYFITALRNFRQHKVFTLINVLGLSVGISSALVIYLIVQYDFSFERFQKDGDRIYRVVSDMRFSGEAFHNSGVPSPLPDAAGKEITGLDITSRIYTWGPRVSIRTAAAAKPAVFKNEPGITFADNNYFTLFNFYTWLAGSPRNALHSPFQVVLTESRARTYFPGSDPSRAIGRTITYDDSITCTVAGVVKDPGVNTDFTFKEFVSRSTIYNTKGLRDNMLQDDWQSINGGSQYFVKLRPGVSPKKVNDQIAELRKKYAKDTNEHGDYMAQVLQPLYDIHFNADYGSFNERVAHKPTLYGLILVAVFLLVLGCINFINLTTAQASQRAKEIGIRKTLGSSVKQLITQFLGETFLLVLISLLVSLALAPQLLRIFSDFIPKNLHFDIIGHPGIAGFLAMLLVVVTLLAGFYPAFVLAGFKPVQVLKNRTAGTTPRRVWLRQTLTVSQFVIAQFFVMGTFIVSRQIRYSLDADLGFKKQGIVYFNTPYPWGRNQDRALMDSYESKRQVLMQKIRSLPGVALVSEGSDVPSSGGNNSQALTYADGKKEVHAEVTTKVGDSNYLALFHIPLLAGHVGPASDTMKELVINQTYARLLGFNDPREAIGKVIGTKFHHPIVGVMADFHQTSLHTAIKPMAFYTASDEYWCIQVALQAPAGGADWKSTNAKIEKAFKEVYPEEDFSLTFFDENIARFYTAEQNIASLLRWATGLTVFISFLGLLGLVIFSTNLRVKEIGVRKVLGASVTQLVSVLSKDFVKLVALAFLIAVPIAGWASWKWLESFAYRATFGWWLFPLSGLAMIVLALGVMCIRTVRVASANPVNSLRSE